MMYCEICKVRTSRGFRCSVCLKNMCNLCYGKGDVPKRCGCYDFTAKCTWSEYAARRAAQ